MSYYDDNPEDWLASFSELPDLSPPTPEDEAEAAWFLVADMHFEQHPEGLKIVQQRFALHFESDERRAARMGKQICIETSDLSPEETKAAKAELAREGEQDRAYFAEKHMPLDEREKAVRAALKAEFMTRFRERQGLQDD
ncbi:MAG: hypothetical protein CSA70_00335 [Rhodobacterales bacterium]|nr:MAG: hypothetical protein CSA70_00335 [Rhodobacterales bacterium]